MQKIAVLAVVSALTGCATVLPMTSGGARVLQINAQTARACNFIQAVQYTTTMYGLGKDPAIVQGTGENGLHNAVADAGGNAFVLRTDDADWFWGHIAYSGDAYHCPEAVLRPDQQR